ncbi:ANTAR domain-containing protein [Streptomyces sp. NPDC102467]|uniref:ANTAR domain-containing protein n=1 Tax=Streptomyces sp. NPDC102467 TaxID=3366179 RepID=UPI0038096A58
MAPAPQHDAAAAAQGAGHAAELKDEIARLKQVMGARSDVDQAVGVLAAVGRISPAEAWDALREVSMHTDIRLRSVARQLIAWARTGDLIPEISGELRRQLPLYHSEPMGRPRRHGVAARSRR